MAWQYLTDPVPFLLKEDGGDHFKTFPHLEQGGRAAKHKRNELMGPGRISDREERRGREKRKREEKERRERETGINRLQGISLSLLLPRSD